MSELYCDGDDMADLASSVYPASSAVAGLIVVTPYICGTSDADVVLKFLKLEMGVAYTDFLDRKLVEWYAAAPKSEDRKSVV